MIDQANKEDMSHDVALDLEVAAVVAVAVLTVVVATAASGACRSALPPAPVAADHRAVFCQSDCRITPRRRRAGARGARVRALLPRGVRRRPVDPHTPDVLALPRRALAAHWGDRQRRRGRCRGRTVAKSFVVLVETATPRSREREWRFRAPGHE